METFNEVKKLFAQYRQYNKQHIYLYKDVDINEHNPKYALLNEILRLVSNKISITRIAKELGIARQSLYVIGVRKRLKKEGRHLLDGVVILHRTMQELRNVQRTNDKLVTIERQRLKDLIYNKIAYINRYYYISLSTISTALGYRSDYLNKSLARKGSKLYNMLKSYGDSTEKEEPEVQEAVTQADRLEEADNGTGTPPFTA